MAESTESAAVGCPDPESVEGAVGGRSASTGDTTNEKRRSSLFEGLTKKFRSTRMTRSMSEKGTPGKRPDEDATTSKSSALMDKDYRASDIDRLRLGEGTSAAAAGQSSGTLGGPEPTRKASKTPGGLRRLSKLFRSFSTDSSRSNIPETRIGYTQVTRAKLEAIKEQVRTALQDTGYLKFLVLLYIDVITHKVVVLILQPMADSVFEELHRNDLLAHTVVWAIQGDIPEERQGSYSYTRYDLGKNLTDDFDQSSGLGLTDSQGDETLAQAIPICKSQHSKEIHHHEVTVCGSPVLNVVNRGQDIDHHIYTEMFENSTTNLVDTQSVQSVPQVVLDTQTIMKIFNTNVNKTAKKYLDRMCMSNVALILKGSEVKGNETREGIYIITTAEPHFHGQGVVDSIGDRNDCRFILRGTDPKSVLNGNNGTSRSAVVLTTIDCDKVPPQAGREGNDIMALALQGVPDCFVSTEIKIAATDIKTDAPIVTPFPKSFKPAIPVIPIAKVKTFRRQHLIKRVKDKNGISVFRQDQILRQFMRGVVTDAEAVYRVPDASELPKGEPALWSAAVSTQTSWCPKTQFNRESREIVVIHRDYKNKPFADFESRGSLVMSAFIDSGEGVVAMGLVRKNLVFNVTEIQHKTGSDSLQHSEKFQVHISLLAPLYEGLKALEKHGIYFPDGYLQFMIDVNVVPPEEVAPEELVFDD